MPATCHFYSFSSFVPASTIFITFFASFYLFLYPFFSWFDGSWGKWGCGGYDPPSHPVPPRRGRGRQRQRAAGRAGPARQPAGGHHLHPLCDPLLGAAHQPSLADHRLLGLLPTGGLRQVPYCTTRGLVWYRNNNNRILECLFFQKTTRLKTVYEMIIINSTWTVNCNFNTRSKLEFEQQGNEIRYEYVVV